MIFLILLAVNSVNAGLTPALLGSLEFSFEGSENCEGFDGKIKLDNLLLEQLGRNKMAMSGALKMDIPLTDQLTVKNIISKCPSKTERGMCEDFPPTIVNDLCKKLPEKGQSWSEFISKLRGFLPNCPVQEGSYEFERFPVDLNNMANMPLMEGYWVLTTEGYIGEDKVMCMESEISFAKAKSKKKKTG